MKYFVVALLSFFENNIEQFKIEAENEFEAVKKALIEFVKTDEAKQREREFQNSEFFPVDMEGLDDFFSNTEMSCSVTEVSSF